MANGHDAARAARMGALLLTGGIVAVLLLWGLFIFAALPNRLSGMDQVHALVTYLATGVCAVILILAHFAIIRQLRAFAARMGNAAR